MQIYESYSVIIDYGVQLSDDETNTSIHMIAHMIHQIEYMFSWNDSLPDDAELTFVIAALDQCKSRVDSVQKITSAIVV